MVKIFYFKIIPSFMLLACIITNVLAIALPSLRISPLLRIVTMMLFYTAALLISVVYIQSIGSGMDAYSGLFISSLLPVKPRKLTKKEKEALLVPKELKEILIGLVLGDLNVQKQKNGKNVRLRFGQGAVNKEYLFHLYELFKSYCSCPLRGLSLLLRC
jgi:hypothetical protein